MFNISFNRRFCCLMSFFIQVDRMSFAFELRLPKAPNVTQSTIINEAKCAQKKCALQALDEKLPQNIYYCDRHLYDKYFNTSSYAEPWDILAWLLKYDDAMYCRSCDQYFVPLSMYVVRAQVNFNLPLFAIKQGHNAERAYDPSKVGNVRFSNVLRLLRTSLCVFVTPITLLANVLNVRLLYAVLKNSGGAALYYHMFELVTDVLSTVTYAGGELFFYWVQHERESICAMARFTIPGQKGWTLLQLFTWYNQLFLTLLVKDRMTAFRHPFVYQAQMHKKVAWKNFFIVIFGSVMFHFPFIFAFNFGPTKNSIAEGFGVDSTVLNMLNYVILSFYSTLAPFGLVVLQFYYSLHLHKHFKTYLENSQKTQHTAEDKAKLQKQEKAKKQLLIGTVGLNIFVAIVTGMATIFGNTHLGKFLVRKTGSKVWYDHCKDVFFTARSFAIFANSTACVLLHVVTCGSYRRAFKNLFCSNNSVTPA